VLIAIYNLFWALTYRAHQINSVPKTYSVTIYSMQLSRRWRQLERLDVRSWTSMCV
jgi:hypothetical protein